MSRVNEKMNKNSKNNNKIYQGSRQNKDNKTKRGNQRWEQQDS
jgi:hypothetical protein